MKGLLLLVLLVGCPSPKGPTAPALPALPGQGGPAWVELQSEHFTMWTDTTEARGRELIREMEHLRQIVLGTGLAQGAASGRSLVLALRDRREVGVFVPSQFIAYAWGSGGWLYQPVIVFPADVEGSEIAIVTHELTHVISYNIIRRQPRWFAEGLAGFFATVRRDPSNTSGDVGRPLDYIVARLRQHFPTPVATMFACKEPACIDDMFYATAWAMFAMLVNTRPAELSRYTALLDSSEDAWKEVFPTLTPAVLDDELRAWLKHGRHTIVKFNVAPREWPVTKRALGDADVLAMRGLLRFMFAPEKPAPAELADALRVDPDHVLASYLTAAIAKDWSVETARRLTTTHPDDWRAWWMLGRATNGRGEAGRAARDKVCALMPAAGAVPDPMLCK